jgi:hypothetical protein
MKSYIINQSELDLNVQTIKKSILLEIAATAMLANLKLRKQKS